MGAGKRLRVIARSTLGHRGWALARRLGFRPRANQAASGSVRYPGGRRAALVLSADLELAWAWRYARVRDPRGLARDKACNGRRNMSRLLDVCDEYVVPVTWATVGHLFLRACRRTAGVAHPDIPRVPHFANRYWAYQQG